MSKSVQTQIKQQKIHFFAKKNQITRSKQLLAICEITGLHISLEVPYIPGKVLSYKNPLADVINSIGIAKLSYKEKQNLPIEIMAATCLSLLSHYKKISDKLSGVERNALLSYCSPYILHSLQEIFLSPKSSIEKYPSISLQPCFDFPHETAAKISSYIEIIKGESTFENKTYSVASPIKKKEKKIKNVTSELRKALKFSLTSLHEEGLCSVKLFQVLNVISQGNNLYTLNPSIRAKVLEKLATIESTNAKDLFQIISDAANNEEEEDITQHFSAKPKSLLEILAEKTGQSIKTESLEKAEEFFYPTFSHADCDTCQYNMADCKTLQYCYILEQQREESLEALKADMRAAAEELGYEIPKEAEDDMEYIQADAANNHGENDADEF